MAVAADNQLFARDASAREPFRRRVNELYEQARELDDWSKFKLFEAKGKMSGRKRTLWRDARSDLHLAACRCNNPDLKGRIKHLHDDVLSAIYG